LLFWYDIINNIQQQLTMGVKHFFAWYKTNFAHCIQTIPRKGKLKDTTIDNLLLDMNGIFHTSAQRIFKYGNCKPPRRLTKHNTVVIPVNNEYNQRLLFADVCLSVEQLIILTKPTKRVILCVDGPGPLSKQNQQRQRRFKNSNNESTPDDMFDSNCITPGTKFMDDLSKYIDAYLLDKVRTSAPLWKGLEIYFSSEKVPGEGEHKAIQFIRDFGTDTESYCINGADADLIMLALTTHKPNFYVIREDMYNDGVFFCLDIMKTRQNLINRLKWESNDKLKYNNVSAINDFVFICFILGNDFLPHIPSIEIIEDGIELMIDIYLDIASEYGHLTSVTKTGKVVINISVLEKFLHVIGTTELDNFKRKLGKSRSFFPDELMMRFASNNEKGWNIDLDGYISEYNQCKFTSNDDDVMRDVTSKYITGLQWVLTYYTTGIPSWKWFFPYQYAPTASTLMKFTDAYKPVRHGNTKPYKPLQQLLSVLPPASSKLLPPPLDVLLSSSDSPLAKYCPTTVKIDLAGKRKEWEGLVLLPIMDQAVLKKEYTKCVKLVDPNETERNRFEEIVKY